MSNPAPHPDPASNEIDLDKTTFAAGNHRWTVRVDVETIRRVKRELQIDLTQLTNVTAESNEISLLQRLHFDDVLLVDLISVILTPQILEREMSAEDFARCMLGDAIALAMESLIAAVINFTRPQRRGLIESAWQKSKLSESSATQQMISNLEKLPIEQMTIDRVNAATELALKKWSGDSPASPASPPPAPTPSAN
jgi:hypothetical protein